MKKQIKTMLKITLMITCGISLTIGAMLLILHLVGFDIPFGNQAIYKYPISSISIKYYEGYNMGTGNALNGLIPLNEVKLESNEFRELSNLIKDLKKVNVSKNSEEYQHMIYDHMSDYYEIDVNGDFVLYIGDEYGFSNNTDEYFSVSDEFFNKVNDITKKNSEENLYKKIDAKKASLLSRFGKIELTNEELEELSTIKYYKINTDKNYDDESLACIIELDNDRTIYIYDTSIYFNYDDGSKEYIHSPSLQSWIVHILQNHGSQIKNFYSLTQIDKKSGTEETIDINEIPDGYFAEFSNIAFNDNNIEESYNTYFYKQNNEENNYGFDYLYVIFSTTKWNNQKDIIVVRKGSVLTIEDIFKVAEKHEANSKVTLPDNTTYTFDEYRKLILSN